MWKLHSIHFGCDVCKEINRIAKSDPAHWMRHTRLRAKLAMACVCTDCEQRIVFIFLKGCEKKEKGRKKKEKGQMRRRRRRRKKRKRRKKGKRREKGKSSSSDRPHAVFRTQNVDYLVLSRKSEDPCYTTKRTLSHFSSLSSGCIYLSFKLKYSRHVYVCIFLKWRSALFEFFLLLNKLSWSYWKKSFPFEEVLKNCCSPIVHLLCWLQICSPPIHGKILPRLYSRSSSFHH